MAVYRFIIEKGKMKVVCKHVHFVLHVLHLTELLLALLSINNIETVNGKNY